MRLVMASYFEPENHGEGRKIGITSGKPRNVEVDFRFDSFDPGELYWDYKNKKIDSDTFVSEYKRKMAEFVSDVRETAKAEGKSVEEVLPFEDGDTLLSWEHSGHTSFREFVAAALVELGYDVIGE